MSAGAGRRDVAAGDRPVGQRDRRPGAAGRRWRGGFAVTLRIRRRDDITAGLRTGAGHHETALVFAGDARVDVSVGLSVVIRAGRPVEGQGIERQAGHGQGLMLVVSLTAIGRAGRHAAKPMSTQGHRLAGIETGCLEMEHP